MRYLLLFVHAWFYILFLSCGEGADPMFQTSIDTDLAAQELQNERLDRLFNNQSLLPAKLIVRVSDIQGNPIGRTQVKIGNEQYSTDNDGLVYIANQSLRPTANGLICNKEGYFEAIKSVNVTGNEQIINVTLIQRSFSRDFIASLGGSVELQGIELEFEPMSISRKDGTSYEGRVIVAAIYYDPEDESFNQFAPGQFYGLTNQDQLSSLATYGMVQIEMTDADGNELEISDGHKVAVTIPASEIAPESIPLWNLNEDYGLWVEEGIAIKESGTYRFEVSHFSTYNCDVPIEPCDVAEDHRIKVLNNTGLTMRHQNLDLFVTTPEDASRMIPFGFITTDGFGEFQFISCIEVSSFYIKSANCNELNGPYYLNDDQTIELSDIRYDFDLAINGTECVAPLIGKNFVGSFSTRSTTIGFGGTVGGGPSFRLSSCVDVSNLETEGSLSLTILDDNQLIVLDDILVEQQGSTEWGAAVSFCDPSIVTDDYIVEFGDRWFEMEVMEQLGIEEITFGQAKEITRLSLSYSSISSLSGIEFFPNLEILVVSNATIPNLLEQLSNNKKLKQLWLREVGIDSDKGIAQLQELEILRINLTPLEFIDEITELENLRIVDLQSNRIESILKPFVSDQLTVIDLAHNKLSTISNLSNISTLDTIDVKFNNIQSFQDLVNVPSLTYMNIENNALKDYSSIGHLTQLKELISGDLGLKSYTGLERLTSLEKLVTRQLETSFDIFSNLTELHHLEFSRSDGRLSPFEDLNWLAPLLKLEYLALFSIEVNDISALSGLPALSELYMGSTTFSDVNQIRELDQLSILHLPRCGIDTIEPFLPLTNLTQLNVRSNNLSEYQKYELRIALPVTEIFF